MKVKILFEGKYVISSILNGNQCPVVNSPLLTDPNFSSAASRLIDLMKRIAENGLQNISSSLSHSIHKEPKIFELIRGDLRLFYFHGDGNRVVICTELIAKKTSKVDKKAVRRAIKAYNDYCQSCTNNTLVELGVDDEG